MTIPQIYESKEKAVYPKTEFVDFLHGALLKAEKEDAEWLEIELEAPTRAAVMTWVTGRSKPSNPLFLKTLSKATNIKVKDLF